MKSNTEAFLAHAEAQMSALKPGDELLCDDGFTCIKPWSKLTVFADAEGQFYISCDEGRHYLDGQLPETGDVLVGVRLIHKHHA